MAHRSPSAKASRRRPVGKHLQARTAGIRIVNRAAFTIFLVTGCVAMAALSIPQMRKLRSLKEELARANAQEHHVRFGELFGVQGGTRLRPQFLYSYHAVR